MLLNYYGAHIFFLPGAYSMLKPALSLSLPSYRNIICYIYFTVLSTFYPLSHILSISYISISIYYFYFITLTFLFLSHFPISLSSLTSIFSSLSSTFVRLISLIYATNNFTTITQQPILTRTSPGILRSASSIAD